MLYMCWVRVNISPRCLRSGHRNSLQRRGPFPRSRVCIPERLPNAGKQHSCFEKYCKSTQKNKIKSRNHCFYLHVPLFCPPADNSLPCRPSTVPHSWRGQAWPTQPHSSLQLQAGELLPLPSTVNGFAQCGST